ncbi:hypothetical protein [Pedobacter helvus]|uniref:Por secretion system C-terminal sorting domain-containing protein n=1 Tax=Pedobacter helvus TaxID=2563444 RepID=A0ABW9JI24_9SPHI|nr:hypothetical protein [Pedobacter ureilyticus]
MRKLLGFSLVILTVFMANVAMADDMELLVRVAKENSKWVSFITSDAKEFDVTLYAADEEVLYQDRIKTVGNKFQTYDLSSLPLGTYQLKMESESKEITYQIEINEENAVLSQPTVVEFKRPVFLKEDNLITLDLNGACAGPVEVLIYNEYNEKLHEEVYGENTKVSKKFDVSKTTSRELTFLVRSAGQEYSETIKL